MPNTPYNFMPSPFPMPDNFYQDKNMQYEMQKISELEKKVNDLEKRINNLEYNKTKSSYDYQTSMNMM